MDYTAEIAAWAQALSAIGTLAVAILAIWGDKIRATIAGPRMLARLKTPQGNLTVRANGTRTIYYHLDIVNRRSWSPARHASVLVTALSKMLPDGTYAQESLVAPLQLTWAYQEFHELRPTISTADVCDIGFVDENAGRFQLSTYVTPYNFSGFIGPNDSMRLAVSIRAHNYESKKPIVLQVSWDGKWDSDLSKMARHLILKQLEPSEPPPPR